MRTKPEKRPLLRDWVVAIGGYRPCDEYGGCGTPLGGTVEAGGAGVAGGMPTGGGGGSMCPSRDAMDDTSCTAPITTRISGQVWPKKNVPPRN